LVISQTFIKTLKWGGDHGGAPEEGQGEFWTLEEGCATPLPVFSANPEAPALTFRPATVADIPLVRDLAERIWRASYSAMLAPEQIDYMLAWMYSPRKLADDVAAGTKWEIALIQEVPVGYFAVSASEGGHAVLHKIYLLPEYQGRGLGQTMLERVFALAAMHEAAEITLRVNRLNARALRAYERAGFRRVDSIVSDIGGGFVMDDYILVRALSTNAGDVFPHTP
jgi:ribosomal protein S18 acetylase RimI-like enzyme